MPSFFSHDQSFAQDSRLTHRSFHHVFPMVLTLQVMSNTSSSQTNRCLGGVLFLMAVILTDVVGARDDDSPVLPNICASTTTTRLTPLLTPDERCWRQIQQVYEKENVSSSLSECEELCGNITVKEIKVDWVRLTPHGDQGVECLMQLTEIRDRTSPDLYWFTSSESDSLVYLGNATVVVTWDYLTEGEKVLEAFFLLVVLVMLKVTLLGNLLVIATMVSIAHKMNLWMVVRTSLAISDLLRAIFVMTLAIHDSLRLMTSSPSTFDFNNSTTMVPEIVDITYDPLIIRRGYSSFCAIVFEMTSVMSLQCLAWLTLERLLICKNIRAEKLLTPYRVSIIVMWLTATAFPLFIFWGDRSYSSFDPVTKLTFLFPSEADLGVSQTMFLIQKTYLMALFFFTVVGSVQTMITFRVRSKEELIELTKHSPMTQAKQQKIDDSYIMKSMKLMLVAYLVSVLPHFFFLVPSLRRQTRFLYFVFWWIFILSSSWNWYLYNMRSTFFRNQVAGLALSFPCLPAALEERLRARWLLPTSVLNSNWDTVWYELDDFLRKQSSNHKTKSRRDPEKAKRLDHSVYT